MLEAVGCEKGTLESSVGEDPVDDLEGGRSAGLMVPSCVCLSQYLCQHGTEGNRTSTRGGFDAVSALDFDLFFGVSMPRARCDSLFSRQSKLFVESNIG